MMKTKLSQTLLVALMATVLAACSGQAEPVSKTPSDVATTQQPNVPQGWITSYDGALELAKKENRPVLIDFTGSDWCGWCKKMTRDTYSKAAFTDYAKNNLVLLYLDYPSGKPQTKALEEQNEKLKKEYGVRGYPTQVLLSPDGKVLWKNGGYLSGGPDALIAAIKKAEKAKG